MKLITVEHLSDIILPLKIKFDGEVPNLEGCKDLKVWGELTELVTNREELPKDWELRLFLDDYPDTNSNLCLFWIFPQEILY